MPDGVGEGNDNFQNMLFWSQLHWLLLIFCLSGLLPCMWLLRGGGFWKNCMDVSAVLRATDSILWLAGCPCLCILQLNVLIMVIFLDLFNLYIYIVERGGNLRNFFYPIPVAKLSAMFITAHGCSWSWPVDGEKQNDHYLTAW